MVAIPHYIENNAKNKLYMFNTNTFSPSISMVRLVKSKDLEPGKDR